MCAPNRRRAERALPNDLPRVLAEVTDDENTVAGQEEEGTEHGSVASVRAAKAATFRHAALGPGGAPPVPDPRLLEWAIPET